MNNQSYYNYNNLCKSLTNALTNNQKYILPCDEVYSKQVTHMMYYPARDSSYGLKSINTRPYALPEEIKAYDIKNSYPHPKFEHQHKRSQNHIDIIHNNKCSSCGGI